MSPSRPHISASYYTALQRYAAARGLNIEDLQRTRDIDLQLDDSPEGSLSCGAFVAIVEGLSLQATDEAFGLHFVESLPPKPAGVYQHIVFNSRTLRDAFQAISRFLGLVTDAFQICYEESGDIGWLRFVCPYNFGGCTQFVDGQLALIALRARQLVGENCSAVRVDMMRAAPTSLKEFRRVFGVLPNFGQPLNRIGFDIAVLAKPLPSADPNLRATAAGYASQLLGLSGRDYTFSTLAANFIAGALQRGDVSETQACIELGITARTLQRNLATEGTTFKALLDETRARMARHYLIDTDLSLTAIAFLLGYSELSAFSRAAKVWLGETPSALRKRHRPGSIADKLHHSVDANRKRQPAGS